MSQQRVDLNVGGIRYSTTISTLTREPDSMLGRMFSPSWNEPYSAMCGRMQDLGTEVNGPCPNGESLLEFILRRAFSG